MSSCEPLLMKRGSISLTQKTTQLNPNSDITICLACLKCFLLYYFKIHMLILIIFFQYWLPYIFNIWEKKLRSPKHIPLSLKPGERLLGKRKIAISKTHPPVHSIIDLPCNSFSTASSRKIFTLHILHIVLKITQENIRGTC